jgi:hypothetical protein
LVSEIAGAALSGCDASFRLRDCVRASECLAM